MSRAAWPVGVALIALLGSPAIAQEPHETPQRRAERILDQDATADFLNTPFGDVLKSLAEEHGLPIELSLEASKAGLVQIDEPVTLYLRDLTLRSCVYLLSDKYGLNHTIKPDGTLLIVPATKENLAIRVKSKRQWAAEKRITQLMKDEESALRFRNTSFNRILAYLSDAHDCIFTIDPRIDKEGDGLTKEPLTIESPFLPLEQTLKTLLTPLNLQAVVRHEVIMITPRDSQDAEVRPAEVEKAYGLKINLELKERSLAKLARELGEKAEVPVVCDFLALKAAKVDLSLPIEIEAKKVPLRDILKSLPPVVPPLQFVDRGGVILITPVTNLK